MRIASGRADLGDGFLGRLDVTPRRLESRFELGECRCFFGACSTLVYMTRREPDREVLLERDIRLVLRIAPCSGD
jgi:hypothetical protein